MEEIKTTQIKKNFPSILGMTENDNNLLVAFPNREITITNCEKKKIEEIIKEIKKQL